MLSILEKTNYFIKLKRLTCAHYSLLKKPAMEMAYGLIYHVITCKSRLNSLPNDKILDWSKFKAFADDEI